MTTIVNQKAGLLKVQTLTTTLILIQKQNSHSQWISTSKTASNHWAMLINVHLSKARNSYSVIYLRTSEQLGQKVGGGWNNIPTHTICLVLRLTYCVYLVTYILYFVTYILCVFCHWHTVWILSMTYYILSLTHCVYLATDILYFVTDTLCVFCGWHAACIVTLHESCIILYANKECFSRTVTMVGPNDKRTVTTVGPNDKRQGADKGLGFMYMSAASWLWTSWSNSSRHWHGNDDDNDCDEDKKANHDHYLFLKQTWHQHALIFFWGVGSHQIYIIIQIQTPETSSFFLLFFPDSYTWHSY